MKIADDIMYSLFKDEEPNNAIDLLKFDHRNVNAMFVLCLKEEDSGRRSALLKEIIEELTLHAAAEEKYIYPILNVQDEPLSQEAYEEHHVMKLLLAEASQLNGSEPSFKAKVKVLSEIVNHHVLEEEAQMLPKVQHSGFDMKELADKIKIEKERMRDAKASAMKNPTTKAKLTSKAKTAAAAKPKLAAKAKPVAKIKPTAAKAKSAKKAPQVNKKVTPTVRTKNKATTSRKRSAA